MVNRNSPDFSKQYEWDGLWSEGNEWDGLWSKENVTNEVDSVAREELRLSDYVMMCCKPIIKQRP